MRNSSNVEVSTGSLSVSDRFPFWADVVAQTFVALECDTPDKAKFSGSIRHCQIGQVGITDVAASAQRARRTPASIARGPSDDLIAVLQIEGPCQVGQSAQAARLEPGGGAMVRTAQPYAFEFPVRFRQLVLKLPRSLIGGPDFGSACGLTLTKTTTHLLSELAFCALEEAPDMSRDEEIGIERAFGALLRSAQTGRPSPDVSDNQYASIYSVARIFIQQNLADPLLNPATVAANAGLSARTLARVFAMRGQTVDRTIWAERLNAARRDLADPRLQDTSITTIAFSWAFSDTAHFSRSFSKAYGVAPRQYRQAEAAGLRKDMAPRR